MEVTTSRRNQLRSTSTLIIKTVTSLPSMTTSVTPTASEHSTDDAYESTTMQPHGLLGGMSHSAQLSVAIVAALTALVIILAVLNVLVEWWIREHMSSAYAQQDEAWFSHHHHGHNSNVRNIRRSSGNLSTHHAHHGINVPSSASRRFGMMDFSLSHGGPAGRIGASRHSSRLMPRL